MKTMDLKRLRLLKGMNQKQLAFAVGVTQAYISALESGARKNPSLEVTKRLTEILDCTIDDLVTPKRMRSRNRK